VTQGPFPVPVFPLVVSASSARDAALVLVDRPLASLTHFTMRSPSLERTCSNIIALFEPRTLAHVNGTCWQTERPIVKINGVFALTVRAACECLGIELSRFAIIERLLDAYPELGPRLLPLQHARVRTDGVRSAQPLVAALIVAHACSVAHLLERG
jgi:hypothetical protein